MPAKVDEALFEEVQSFRQPWLWALLIVILLVLAFGFGLVVIQAPDQPGKLTAVVGLGLGIAVVIGGAVLMYTLSLSVRLDAKSLHVRFGPLVQRVFLLEKIARWEARTYRPILEYGGWGIRRGWKGIAYNVSGNRGVQLEFTSGKRLLIGSQRPEELAAAISRAKQRDAG